MTLKEAIAALRSDTPPTVLALFENDIGDEGAKALASALINNRTLKKLDLAFNNIGPEGAKDLATALKKNDTITEIMLTGNHIGDEGANHFATLLNGNKTLRSLGMANNNIRDKGANDLATGIKNNNTLCKLALGLNVIGDEGAENLATALKDNHTLSSLRLNDNNIGDKGTKAIENLLKDNDIFTELELHSLHPTRATYETRLAINLLLKRNESGQKLIETTLSLLNDSQPDPFDQKEQSIIHFKSARDKLDALNYPKQAMGYIKIQTAITLMEAKHAENQGDYDTAIENLSTITSSNPYFKIAQTALVDMALRLLNYIGDNEERYALINIAMASVDDSNQAKNSIMNILKNSEAIAAGEQTPAPLHAYKTYTAPSTDQTTDQSDPKPTANKPNSNQN